MVAAYSDRFEQAVPLVSHTKPDVGIFAVGLPDGDGVTAAEDVMSAAPCPIVLFTSHGEDSVISRATDAGVMGFLVKPLRPEELSPTLDLAVARFRDIHRLRQQLADRKVIERAKGLLMAREGLSENQAFQSLRRAAMNRRIPMGQLARAIVVAESRTAPIGSHRGAERPAPVARWEIADA